MDEKKLNLRKNILKKLKNIITKNIKDAIDLYKKLNSSDIQLIKNYDDPISKDIIIIPSYLSK